jgi:hypothetical protein
VASGVTNRGGDTAPSGDSRSPVEDHAEAIVRLIEEQRDRTLDEIVAAMHKRKIPGSRTALVRFPKRHGIALKKSPARIRTGVGGRSPCPSALDTRARTA